MAGTIYAGTYTTTILLDNPIQQSPATLTGSISVSGSNAASDSGFYGIAAYAFSLDILGTITASGPTSYGILLAGGGTITNGEAGSNAGLIRSDETGILLSGTAASSVTNFGSIIATSGRGVFLQDGGTVTNGATNEAGADISGGFMGVAIYNAGGVLTNAGTIADTGTAGLGAVLYTGFVHNLAGGTITGIYGVGFLAHASAGATLVNDGLILGSGRDAVELTDGGTVTNHGTMVGGVAGVLALYGSATVHNSGLLEGGYAGIDLLAGGAVVNHAGATLSGSFGLSFGNGTSAGALGTLNNAGLILGTADQGVSMNEGGNAENSGTIYGQAAGFAAFYHTATLQNSGSIGASSAGIGVDFASGGTLTNLVGGAIGGEYGVILADGSAGQTLQNMASLSNAGLILAGTGDGLSLETGFSATNLAGASISGGRYGVFADAQTGVFTNDGLIEGAIGFYGRALVANGSLVEPTLTLIDSGIIIGQSGTAVALYQSHDSLIVDPGASFQGAVIGGGASLILAAGGIGTLGTLGAGMAGFSQITLATGASWDGGGTISAGASFTDDGTLSVIGADFALAGTLIGNGTIVLGAGATLDLAGASASDSVRFTAAGATLALTSPLGDAAPITGFAAGDTLWLPRIADQGLSENFSAGTLSILQAGTAVASVVLKGTYSSSEFALLADAAGGTDLVIPCFTTGTRLATDGGPVAVEGLRPGMRLLTGSGALREICWIGRRIVRGAANAPVQIAQDCFGPGRPAATLRLSPDHAIFLEGVLVPAGRLVAPRGPITQAAARRTEYWHLELDHHDIVLAEGLAVESYLDTGNRGQFTWEAGRRRPPTPRCAPLVLGGAALARARRGLLARTLPRPQGWVWRQTEDGLLAPARADRGFAAFLLPAHAREAILVPALPCRVAAILDGTLLATDLLLATPHRLELPRPGDRRCLELFRQG